MAPHTSLQDIIYSQKGCFICDTKVNPNHIDLRADYASVLGLVLGVCISVICLGGVTRPTLVNVRSLP